MEITSSRMRPQPVDLRSAVANYRAQALPHFYSVGGADVRLFKEMTAAYFLNLLSIRTWVTLLVPLLLFVRARLTGRRLELTAVNDLAGFLRTDNDRSLLRQTMEDLPHFQRLRLVSLLNRRGVVI